VEIHCPARCSCDQNLLNSSGNLHYFVGAACQLRHSVSRLAGLVLVWSELTQVCTGHLNVIHHPVTRCLCIDLHKP
jgi:hypothetical protein